MKTVNVSRSPLESTSASVHVEITSLRYRRSPLVQGGGGGGVRNTLQGICNLTRTVKNSALIGKYKELVGTVYSEPEDGTTVGWYEDDNDEIPAQVKPVLCL